jgi:hypothetical protein
MVRHLGNSVGAAGIQKEGTTVDSGTVAVENTEVGIEVQEVRNRAVGKLPQAVYTVLVRMIHNPHLVNRHM